MPVLVSHIRPYYINYTDKNKIATTGYNFTHSTACYYYQGVSWTLGTNSREFWDIPKAEKHTTYSGYNGKYKDVSVTLQCDLNPANKTLHTGAFPPQEIIEWRKRKHITGISVKRKRNTHAFDNIYYYRQFNTPSYSLVCVKKSMFEKQYEIDYAGALIADKQYWSENQLFTTPDMLHNHFTTDEVKLSNLRFDLPADEDLCFMYNIILENNIEYAGKLDGVSDTIFSADIQANVGAALKPYCDFEIIVQYDCL